MKLSSCPDEIILEITPWIRSLQPLNALCRVNRRLNTISVPILYQRDALKSRPHSSAVNWAAEHGLMSLIHKSLHFGANICIEATMGTQVTEELPSLNYGKVYNRVFYNSPAHPLTLAVQNGHDEIVAYLLERGCSPLMRNPSGFSLLSLCHVSRLSDVCSSEKLD